MKTISLWEPWATAVQLGLKTIETRSWATPYRGPLLIHAAKYNRPWIRHLCKQRPFCFFVHDYNKLVRGGILAKVDLVDVVPADEAYSTYPERFDRTHEKALGDYTPGRYAWILENTVRFSRPVPQNGRQRVFDVQTYTFSWGNNEKRLELKGRECLLAGTAAKNSVCMVFLDDGHWECVDRKAIRKVA